VTWLFSKDRFHTVAFMYGRVDRRKGTVCANVAAYGETEDVHHRTRLVFFTPVNSRVPLSLTAGFCFDLLKFRYGRCDQGDRSP